MFYVEVLQFGNCFTIMQKHPFHSPCSAQVLKILVYFKKLLHIGKDTSKLVDQALNSSHADGKRGRVGEHILCKPTVPEDHFLSQRLLPPSLNLLLEHVFKVRVENLIIIVDDVIKSTYYNTSYSCLQNYVMTWLFHFILFVKCK